MIVAVAASVLIVAALASWVVLRRHDARLMAQSAVVDLRNRSVVRGTEPPVNERPLEISRSVSHLEVYLPLGSSDGSYEVRITDNEGRALWTLSGTAMTREGVTSLSLNCDLSRIAAGLYALQIRRTDSQWNSYAVQMK